MRIVLVNKFWYSRGGAEKVALLTKELLEQAGHTVEIFGMRHKENIFTNDYFTDFIDYNQASLPRKIKFGLRALYNKQAADNFEKLLRDFRPDVIHFHNIYHQLSCSIIGVAKKMKIKTVMTLHDYKFISPNYNLFHHGQVALECADGKYYHCLINDCMENKAESLLATAEAYFVDFMGYKKMIGRYISPSAFLREKFIDAGFKESAISVLQNPLRDSEFVSDNNAGEYVGYVGRLAPEKGVEYLIEAAELLPGINFKIAGIGPSQASLLAMAQKKDLRNLEFVGQKNGAELRDFIARSRLLAVPSVWYENAPMSVIESKAHGKVVVAFAMGGISEILPDDLLVKAKDVAGFAKKIKSWFESDDKKLFEMGVKLREDAEKNNGAQTYLNKLLELYQND